MGRLIGEILKKCSFFLKLFLSFFKLLLLLFFIYIFFFLGGGGGRGKYLQCSLNILTLQFCRCDISALPNLATFMYKHLLRALCFINIDSSLKGIPVLTVLDICYPKALQICQLLSFFYLT